jgi:hypothetical protein
VASDLALLVGVVVVSASAAFGGDCVAISWAGGGEGDTLEERPDIVAGQPQEDSRDMVSPRVIPMAQSRTGGGR